MTTENTVMTITRALTELKRMDVQIENAIKNGTYMFPLTGKDTYQKVSPTNLSVEDAKSKINSSFDTVVGLISRREQIKSSVINSNAQTKVNIQGRSISVAEAIDLKNSVVYKKKFVEALKLSVAKHNQWLTQAESALNDRIEKLLSAAYSGDKGRVDVESTKAITDPQIQQFSPSLLDVRNIGSVIENLQKEIEFIETELDFVLSENNSVTTITV